MPRTRRTPCGSVSGRRWQRCVCFVTLHVAVVACSCALIRHSNDKHACAPMSFWIVARLFISEGSMPIVSKEFSAARGFSRPRAVVCGHYQLSRKWGVVFTCGTQFSFKHFPSHPNWIANGGRSEKFSVASKRIECMERATNIGAFQHFSLVQ